MQLTVDHSEKSTSNKCSHNLKLKLNRPKQDLQLFLSVQKFELHFLRRLNELLDIDWLILQSKLLFFWNTPNLSVSKNDCCNIGSDYKIQDRP